MKNIFKKSLHLALVFLLAGCAGGNDYQCALPEKPAAVVSFDLPKLATRAGLDAGNGDKVLNRFKAMVKSGLEGSGDMVDRIFADVAESGLDLENKVYFFTSEEMSTVGLLAKVLDSSKLESVVEVLHKQQLCQAVRETDGCHWTVIGKWLLAYSDHALLVLGDNKWSDPSKLVRQASMWLRQKEDQGFVSKPDFKKLQASHSDVVAYTSLQLFSRQTLAPLTMGLSAELDLNKIKALTAVNFENGKVTFDIDPLITDDIMNSLIDKKNQTMQPVKGTYLDVFPSKTAFWTTANLKGESFYKFLREIPAVRKFFDYSDLPITLDYGRIFDAIDGDVSMAITDPERGHFIMYADVTQTEFLKVFTELRPMIAKTNGMLILEDRGENAYCFATHDGSVLNMHSGPKIFWLGVKKGRFYFTNREDLIDSRVLGLSLRDCKWGERVAGQHFFAVSSWNGLRTFEYLMHQNFLSSVPKIVPPTMDQVTVESADGKHIRIEWVQTDKKQNLIQVLLQNN